MKTETLNTKAPKVNREIEMEVQNAETLDELTAQVGVDATFDLAMGALNVARQGRIRAMLEKGLSEDEIKNTMKAWKPGIRVSTAVGDPLAAAKNIFANMSDEDKLAYLEQLKAQMG